MKHLITTLLALLLSAIAAQAQFARLQTIHNAPAAPVDVYVNGVLTINDFAFRTATPFNNIPAGVPLSVAVAPATSTSAAQAFYTTSITLENGKTYALTACGIVGNPATPFTVISDNNAREGAANPAKVAVNVLHGATDVSPIDVVVRVGDKIVSNLAYGQFTPYSELPPGVYYLDVKPAGLNVIVGTYKADLTTLTGGTLRVFASGLLSGSPSFGLWAAFANGAVQELPFTPVARVQVIHNAPDQAVDIYANGDLLADDLAYRTASPFVFVPAGFTNLGVALDNSIDVNDTLANFTQILVNGGYYVAVANGILGDPNIPFELAVNTNGRERAADTAQVDIAFFQGSTDWPNLDTEVFAAANGTASNLSFGDFTPAYANCLPEKNDLIFRTAGTQNRLAAYRWDVAALKGKAATVFASGFVGPPSGGPNFGLFAALADGTVVELTALTPFARWQLVQNAPPQPLDLYAGSALFRDDFAFRTATPFMDVPAERSFKVALAPANSTSVAGASASFPVSFQTGKTYEVFVSGIAGNGATPLALFVDDKAKEIGQSPTSVDVAVHHGSPGLPAVDVDAVFLTNDMADNLAYGQFKPYIGLGALKYDFALRAHNDPNVLGSFRADLTGLASKSAYLFASGILNPPGGGPAFGLFAVLPDGTVLTFPTTPTARIQIIHNSPDPTVDVYVGSTLFVNDFVFRTATAFANIPADRDLAFGVAGAGSTSASDAIFTVSQNFQAGKSYAVFASGVVFNMTTPFTLLTDEARETAVNPAKFEFATLHGVLDAPPLDIAVYNGATLVADIAYGEFSPYQSLDPGIYLLQVTNAGTSNVVGTFRADVSGLAGYAGRVFASGLFNPPVGGPAFGLFAALPDGTVIPFPPASTNGRIQIVHNSPSAAVDIYAGNTLLFNDLAFRAATPFVDVPGDVNLVIGVAPANSSSAADAFATFNLNFEIGKTYVIVASGIVGSPATPFTLFSNPNGKEAAQFPFGVDLALHHGALNLPAMDVDAVFDADDVVDNLAYGGFAPYLGLGGNKYDFAIRAHNDPGVLASFRADLAGLEGKAATVFASGLLGAPAGAAFGLFAALPDGAVLELPVTPTARVQIIHNAPDPTVDVYAGNTLLLNDFVFRTATPFITIPADRTIVIGTAGNGSTSSADVLFPVPVSFETGKAYSVFASGLPFNPVTPFTLFTDEARETAINPTKFEFATLHGALNAPAVDIAVVGSGNIVANLAYGAFAPYQSLSPGNYVLSVKAAGTNNALGYYLADLGLLAGNVARVFTSGVVGAPSGGPGFGLFAAFPDGTVVEFPPTAAPALARLQIIHNSPSQTVDVYQNGALLLNDFTFRTATPFFDALANVPISIAIAPGNSTSSADAFATFPVLFQDGKTYIATVSGILNDVTAPFFLNLHANGRETSANAGQVDVAVLHGAPGTTSVDVDAVFVANNVVQDLVYGQYTPYLNLNAEKYDLAVRASGSPNVVATYRADLTGLANGAGCVFASGILSGSPAFGLFMALPNGTVVELPLMPTTRVQIVNNSSDPAVDVYAGNTLLLDNFVFRTATPFFDIPADRNFSLGVAPENSTSAADTIRSFPVNFEFGKSYTVMTAGAVGGLQPLNLFVDSNARETTAPGFSSISVFHGLLMQFPFSIDVEERLAGNLFDNVDFGVYTPYLDFANGEYYLDVAAAGLGFYLGTHRLDPAVFGDKPARIFTSGVYALIPDYRLYAVFPDGSVIELPHTPVARVQIVHNAPEPTVDVYSGSEKILDDFAFHAATPFNYAVADAPISFGIAPANSQSVADVFATFPVTFENRKTYVVMAAGVAGGNPSLGLFANENGRERALNGADVDVSFFNGAPDVPTIDVQLSALVSFDDVAFGAFSDYASLSPGSYLLSKVSDPPFLDYIADFTNSAGQAITLFSSGFLLTGNQPYFEMWAAEADGDTYPLQLYVSTNELDEKLSDLQLSPNPTAADLFVRFSLNGSEQLRYAVLDATGRLVLDGDFGRVDAGEFLQKLDVGVLPAGVYQLEIVSDAGARVEKFAFQK